MNPDQRADLELRIAELTRQLRELHDGYAPGLYAQKLAVERGWLRRELKEPGDANFRPGD